MSGLLDKLQEPEVAGCAIDGSERLDAHRAVLRRKAMIREVFEDFHALFHDLDERLFSADGSVVELGTGIYPVRETIPGVLVADMLAAPHLGCTLDAEAMGFADGSVRAFYLQNVSRHFPHPSGFFAKLERTVAPGGGAILTLEVVRREVIPNWIRYLASGGLNFRPLAPAFAAPVLRGLEMLLSPLRRNLGLHRIIVLRKRLPEGTLPNQIERKHESRSELPRAVRRGLRPAQRRPDLGWQVVAEKPSPA